MFFVTQKYIKIIPSGLLRQSPLEQFEVCSFSTGFTTSWAPCPTVAFLFLRRTRFIAITSSTAGGPRNNLHYLLKKLYNGVRGVVKQNLARKQQYYFSNLFFLFVTLFLTNRLGALPYTFTFTTCGLRTILIARSQFIALNFRGLVQNK